MTTSERLKMYFWLITLIQSRGAIHLSDINAEWKRNVLSGGLEFDRNTFRKHLDTIEEVFGIVFSYSTKKGYYIKELSELSDQIISNLLLSNIQEIGSFTQFKKLGDKIQVESTSTGNQYLYEICQALNSNLLVEFSYHKFTNDVPQQVTLEPYCLKAVKRRWYLFGRKHDNGCLRSYALDRITHLMVSDSHFPYDKRFGIDTHFKNSFGIYVADDMPSNVIIRANELEAKYLRTLPLHKSQHEISPGLFEYHIIITTDFINELFRHGTSLEVLEPLCLRDEMKHRIEEMRKIYA